METRSGLPGNGRDGAPAALDEDRGFAVFWFNPFPALRTYARYPSQYPSRFRPAATASALARLRCWRRSRRPGRSRGRRGRSACRTAAPGCWWRRSTSRWQEPAVTAATGGRQGGGAALTPSGERVIELYRSIEDIARSSAKEEFRAVGKLVRKRRAARADSPRRNSARLSYPGHFKMTVKVCGPLLPRVHPIAPSSRPCSTRPSPSG